MSIAGPAFLHRPLPSLSRISMKGATDWLLEGLRVALPDAVVNAGWRPHLKLVSLTDRDKQQLVERSLFGNWRVAPATDEAPPLSLAIALAPEDVFETRVNLPAAARDDLGEAVSHRLDYLSPLPKHAIAFAIGPVRKAFGERIEVSVAIARKETVKNCLDLDDGVGVSLVGYRTDPCGRFEYVFFQEGRHDAGGRKPTVRFIAAIAAISLLILGADLHLRHRIAAYEAHQRALIETAKAERARFQSLDSVPAGLTPNATGNEAVASLALALQTLPSKVWVQEISIEDNAVSISGYVPDSADWPTQAAPTITASDRPGVQAFSLRLDVERPL